LLLGMAGRSQREHFGSLWVLTEGHLRDRIDRNKTSDVQRGRFRQKWLD
jgi:hypothetical protein